MERKTLFQDDLTEERQPTPGDREDVAQTTRLDPADDGVEDDDDDDAADDESAEEELDD